MSPTTNPTVTFNDIETALVRVRQQARITPLTFSDSLSERYGREIFLKWESRLPTGAFKERGAINFLSQLTDAQIQTGVCAASAGNHALALAYHSARLRIPCTIVMPKTAPLVKVQNTEAYGSRVILEGANFDDARRTAEELALYSGMTFVPAFDHPAIIAGQGTIGLEILEQLPSVDAIVVPVGGGGLISGIAIAVKSKRPQTFILGAQSLWATEAQERHLKDPGKHNRLRPPSIADGIAVKRRGAITGSIMERYVDSLVQLSEPELAHGVIQILEGERALAEGAGAAGVAALSRNAIPATAKHVVVVMSGANIDINVLARLIQADMAERERLARIVVTISDRPGSLNIVSGILGELGANILEVFHDRSFSKNPGAVEVMFLLELRDRNHKHQVFERFAAEGVILRELA